SDRLHLPARSACHVRSGGYVQKPRERAGPLPRLEGQRKLHHQLGRGICPSAGGCDPRLRPNLGFYLWHDVCRLLLLITSLGNRVVIERTTRPMTRRVLMVDDELAQATTAGGRAVHALADELRSRGIQVVEALSCEDGMANVVSDSGFHCVFVNWTLGKNDRRSHTEATELLRALRARNAKVPVFLMADRKVAGTITVEVATLADEFIWLLEDTAAFVGGRAAAAIERYLQGLLPPFAAALGRYDREREYSWAAPGHQGGIAFLKSPIGRVFFDFYGENLFRTDMGIERASLGSLLGHSGPIGDSERYAARVFGAHRSYSVLNGTPSPNRDIMSACVGDNEIALCDRNCHKSIEQGLAITGGIPVFLRPTRNRYGIIGPIPPERLEPEAIAQSIAQNPLAKSAASKRPVY